MVLLHMGGVDGVRGGLSKVIGIGCRCRSFSASHFESSGTHTHVLTHVLDESLTKAKVCLHQLAGGEGQ